MFLFRFKRVFSLRGFRRSCSAPKFLRHPDKIANVVWLSLIIGSCSMLWFLGSQTESPTRMNTWKHLKQCARTGWIQCDGASCQMFPCLHGGSAFLDMSLPGILLQSRSRVSAHPGTWCYCLEYRPWAVDGCTLRQPVCFRSWYSTPTGTCTQLAGYLPFPLAKLKCPHPEFDRHEWNHQKKTLYSTATATWRGPQTLKMRNPAFTNNPQMAVDGQCWLLGPGTLCWRHCLFLPPSIVWASELRPDHSASPKKTQVVMEANVEASKPQQEEESNKGMYVYTNIILWTTSTGHGSYLCCVELEKLREQLIVWGIRPQWGQRLPPSHADLPIDQSPNFDRVNVTCLNA